MECKKCGKPIVPDRRSGYYQCACTRWELIPGEYRLTLLEICSLKPEALLREPLDAPHTGATGSGREG